jgi:hypothetical protein
MKGAPMKCKAAAIITIHRPADMSPSGRRAVAAWIKKQATFLLKYSKELSPRFTARYLYYQR